MDLIMKHLTAGQEKVNVVGATNWYEEQDVDFDEEAKYLKNLEWVSEIISQAIRVIMMYIKVGTISKMANMRKQRARQLTNTRRDTKISKNGVYVPGPPGNKDRTSSGSSGSRMEDMF